jgi:transposase
MNQNRRSDAPDARGLSRDALVDLRRRVVAAVQSGASQTDVARLFGVSRQTVSAWVRAYRNTGDEAFRLATRGRRPGDQLALSLSQQFAIIETITRYTPDGLGMRFRLWTRQAVAELINREFQVALGTTTIGNYLARWGLLADQNLLHHLRVQHALLAMPGPVGTVGPVGPVGPDGSSAGSETGPAWMAGAEMLWVVWRRPYLSFVTDADPGEPTERRSELVAELVRTTALVAVSNRGAMFFRLAEDHCDARVMRDFLDRLTKQVNRKTNVVIGWQPRLHAEELRSWLDDNADTAAVRFVAC